MRSTLNASWPVVMKKMTSLSCSLAAWCRGVGNGRLRSLASHSCTDPRLHFNSQPSFVTRWEQASFSSTLSTINTATTEMANLIKLTFYWSLEHSCENKGSIHTLAAKKSIWTLTPHLQMYEFQVAFILKKGTTSTLFKQKIPTKIDCDV